MRPSAPLITAGLLMLAASALGTPCYEPDNGTGTVELPSVCPEGHVGVMTIIDGLPPGTDIGIDAVLTGVHSQSSTPGGDLGGEIHSFQASLDWTMTGTGDLAGFSRSMSIPVTGAMHTAPRTPGDEVQTFDQIIYTLQGELFGDPDFCVLRVAAGDGNGLPSPGSCTLTELPSGDFAVDSFFDITYRIEFEGCPGSQLEGLAGTTIGAERFRLGEPYYPPIDHDCVLPDDGSGTIPLPPACPDGFAGPMAIIDGLPPGTTLDIDAVLTSFSNVVESPGGSLGGMTHQFDADLLWTLTGTGMFQGFSRTLVIPVTGEMESGPHNPGDPVQTFDQALVFLQGQLFGDPDFCELIVTAGDDFGLPSPGGCTLERVPSGDFAVDSFFDISYRIDFIGCPGGQLDGLAGSTLGTERFLAGEPWFPPVDHSCVLPDNGLGTVDLPPDCPDGYVGTMAIVDGLPPGTTIEIDAVLTDYLQVQTDFGGTLGGELQVFDASLQWSMTGTGALAGFSRTLVIPVSCETHTGPRTPGDPVQTFEQTVFALNGQLFGDPDFCELIVRAGDSAALPSPGHGTLTQLPNGDFAVDSFFDITYQIEFQGCPGSILEGFIGLTQDTRRFQAGERWTTGVPAPGPALRLSNHPNPFNPRTTITFEVPADAGTVRLEIYDLAGRRVRTLARGPFTAGLRRVDWSGEDDSGRRVAAGVYFCALRTDRGASVRKLALIK